MREKKKRVGEGEVDVNEDVISLLRQPPGGRGSLSFSFFLLLSRSGMGEVGRSDVTGCGSVRRQRKADSWHRLGRGLT